MDWINLITELILPVIFAVVGYFLVPLLRDEKIKKAVRVAVQAAEQLFNRGEGAQKNAWVREWIRAKFPSLRDEDVTRLIESAVYEINLIGRQAALTAPVEEITYNKFRKLNKKKRHG